MSMTADQMNACKQKEAFINIVVIVVTQSRPLSFVSSSTSSESRGGWFIRRLATKTTSNLLHRLRRRRTVAVLELVPAHLGCSRSIGLHLVPVGFVGDLSQEYKVQEQQEQGVSHIQHSATRLALSRGYETVVVSNAVDTAPHFNPRSAFVNATKRQCPAQPGNHRRPRWNHALVLVGSISLFDQVCIIWRDLNDHTKASVIGRLVVALV